MYLNSFDLRVQWSVSLNTSERFWDDEFLKTVFHPDFQTIVGSFESSGCFF